jgi:hypothetical protein
MAANSPGVVLAVIGVAATTIDTTREATSAPPTIADRREMTPRVLSSFINASSLD